MNVVTLTIFYREKDYKDNQLGMPWYRLNLGDDAGTVSSYDIWRIVQICSQYRVKYVYVVDAGLIFSNLDYACLSHNIPLVLYSDTKKMRITKECFTRRDGDQSYYSRKIWLYSSNLKTQDRHKRLNSICFINAGNYIGGVDVDKFVKAMGAPDFSCALSHLNDKLYIVTSLYLYNPENGKPNYYTLGGVAKNYYLLLKYKDRPLKDRLQAYQAAFPISKEIDCDLHMKKLLPGGIIYLKDTSIYENVYKYDKVSLFPAVERSLKIPRFKRKVETNIFPECMIDPSKSTFIYVFKNLLMKRKNNMPALFPQENYNGVNKDIVDIKNIAIYDELFKEYLNYYDLIDYELSYYIELDLIEDNAITKYVDILFKLKAEETDPILKYISKLLLNNLHGKFAQTPILKEKADLILGQDGIKNEYTFTDLWYSIHFDYLRGAYIYSMARAEMLKNLYKIAIVHNINLNDNLLYSDTDSAILKFELDKQFVGYNLGDFKFENKLNKFQAWVPKVYIMELEDKSCKCVCAGARVDTIYEYLKLNGGLYFDNFNPKTEYPIRILKRFSTGANYVIENRKLVNFNDYNEEKGEL